MATPRDDSYGTLNGVGMLVPKHSGTEQDFRDTTRPTDDHVVRWLDQISQLCNSMLAKEGFAVPATAKMVKMQLDFFVEQEVASMVEGINGFGRFGPTAKKGGSKGRFALLVEDVQEFIEHNSVGWERLGTEREVSLAENIAYKESDNSGDSLSPIFQREAFGNVFQDWDS